MKQSSLSMTIKSLRMLCLYRFFTDLSRDYSLFSLATPSIANDFLIFKKAASNMTEVHIRNQLGTFVGQNYKLNTWQSICSTWDSVSGLAQLWVNGMPSIRKFVSSGSSINGPIIIVLGQVQCLCTVST